jgi:hypothetical protein
LSAQEQQKLRADLAEIHMESMVQALGWANSDPDGISSSMRANPIVGAGFSTKPLSSGLLANAKTVHFISGVGAQELDALRGGTHVEIPMRLFPGGTDVLAALIRAEKRGVVFQINVEKGVDVNSPALNAFRNAGMKIAQAPEAAGTAASFPGEDKRSSSFKKSLPPAAKAALNTAAGLGVSAIVMAVVTTLLGLPFVAHAAGLALGFLSGASLAALIQNWTGRPDIRGLAASLMLVGAYLGFLAATFWPVAVGIVAAVGVLGFMAFIMTLR